MPSLMHSVDLFLFASLGAGPQPIGWLLSLALHASAVSSWLIAATVLWVAVRGRASLAEAALILVLAAVAGVLAHALANALNTPRPFALGLSPDYAMHSGRGGFPSTHASVMFAVATFLLWRPATRAASAWVAVLAMATGLARIYLGIHFLLDVLGGLAFGAIIGSLGAALASLPAAAGVFRRSSRPPV